MKVLRVEVAKDCTAVKRRLDAGRFSMEVSLEGSPAVAVRCDPLI
jgi:hypothetical protein